MFPTFIFLNDEEMFFSLEANINFGTYENGRHIVFLLSNVFEPSPKIFVFEITAIAYSGP